MRVGVLGGTFDPIHLGHLRAAESAREALGLSSIVFVPAAVPPHREGPVGSALDRFAMVSLATAGHPCFLVSDIELRREGPSYTVDTLAALRRERPADEFLVIVGSDAYAEMATWKDVGRLLSLAQVAVVARPGDGPPAPPGPHAIAIAGPALPISATEVRSRVREGLSVRYLVPEAVADYIAKRGLYR